MTQPFLCSLSKKWMRNKKIIAKMHHFIVKDGNICYTDDKSDKTDDKTGDMRKQKGNLREANCGKKAEERLIS